MGGRGHAAPGAGKWQLWRTLITVPLSEMTGTFSLT